MIRIRRHEVEKARQQAEFAQREATEAAAGPLSLRRPEARVIPHRSGSTPR
jgi:hypothetical protein